MYDQRYGSPDRVFRVLCGSQEGRRSEEHLVVPAESGATQHFIIINLNLTSSRAHQAPNQGGAVLCCPDRHQPALPHHGRQRTEQSGAGDLTQTEFTYTWHKTRQ